MYETFEHTADVGLRIRAGRLDELFAEAARGLYSVIVANPEAIRALHQIAVEVVGEDRAELLHDWLDELLFLFSTQHLLLAQFDIAVTDRGLRATARGEPVDPERHQLDAEVKAVTYHGLKVERSPDGWLAEVVLDL